MRLDLLLLLRGGRVEGIRQVGIFLRHDAQLARYLVAGGNLGRAQTTGREVPEVFWIHTGPHGEPKSGNRRGVPHKDVGGALSATSLQSLGLFHIEETC